MRSRGPSPGKRCVGPPVGLSRVSARGHGHLTTPRSTRDSERMVRQGVLAFLVCGLVACTTDVDDPANFTAGMTQGNGSSSSGGTGNATDGNSSGVADNGNSATSTTGNADGTGANTSSTGGGDGPASCGNGDIDAGEQCDGANLQGFDCGSLGLGGGTLACDPVMCTFDTSMCTGGGGTSG